jgi:DNA end-binding protein Ku
VWRHGAASPFSHWHAGRRSFADHFVNLWGLSYHARMAARAISSGTISFGLVSIPVKLFTATSSQQVHFNMLHGETSGRVKQQYVHAGTGEIVSRKDMVKGYEYSRGQFVVFTEQELKQLESARSSSIDIVEFAPLASVDLIQVEKTYYLGPDKGGDKAYRLLAESMLKTGKVAVGRWAAKGKEQLVLIRPYKDGLMLHQMFYADEVRAFDEVDTGATFAFSDLERDLAVKLIGELTVPAFDATKYRDEYATRVRAAVEQKVAGQQLQVVGEVPKAQIIDLFEALKQSLAQVKAPGELPAATDQDLHAEAPLPVKKTRGGSGSSKKSAASG